MGTYQPTAAAFQSIRAYRRFLNTIMVECYGGKRPMGDLTRAAAAAKTGAELLMAERTLTDAGLDFEAPAHPLGDDGGMRLPEPGRYVERTLTDKVGTSSKGTPVEERKVSTTGPADAVDDELRLPAPEDF